MEETWYHNDRLDKILNAAALDVVKTSKQQIEGAAVREGAGMQPGVSNIGSSAAIFENQPKATGRFKFRPDVTPVLYTVYERRSRTGYSPDSVFYIFPPTRDLDVPNDYVVVGGANFNTYAQVFSSDNIIKVELGGPYGGHISRHLRPNTLEVLLAKKSDLVEAK
jgi:hypothetical protein